MADWKNVGRIKGEKGDKGDKGDPGEGTQGEKGNKGDPGNPLVIKDTVDSESDLPTDGKTGEAYIVDGDLYVYQ